MKPFMSVLCPFCAVKPKNPSRNQNPFQKSEFLEGFLVSPRNRQHGGAARCQCACFETFPPPAHHWFTYPNILRDNWLSSRITDPGPNTSTFSRSYKRVRHTARQRVVLSDRTQKTGRAYSFHSVREAAPSIQSSHIHRRHALGWRACCRVFPRRGARALGCA